MANLTDYYENKILNGLTGAQQLQTPMTIYLALFTSNPGETGDVAGELSGLGYERVEITSKFPLAVGSGQVKNSADIVFPTATSNWPTATHIGLMESDIENASDMMAYSELEVPIQILTDQAFIFNTNNLILNMD